MNEQAEQIADEMAATRARTLELFDMAREQDLHESPGGGFRPIIWHLAHIGVFEAYWLLQKVSGEAAPDERYERVFDPIQTPREASTNLPSRREMEDYLRRVRSRALRCLEESDFDSTDPLLRSGYVFQLVLEHERQHQETLGYLLHMLDPLKKTRPGAKELQQRGLAGSVKPPVAEGEMIVVPGGDFEMGAVWNVFAYDNELPAHSVFVPAFKIARLLTTNAEYAQFVAGDGYDRRELWSEEGWEWRTREGWTCPLYWQKAGADGWSVRGMFEGVEFEPNHPVSGVSWYEAEAYARFAGKRLPTEREWEKAASWDGTGGKRRFAWGDSRPTAALCNSDNRFWGTTPVGSFPEGASAVGCLDMTGNVWEWTSDAFDAYPGFAPFPYPEYSQTWFDGDHRVLKGGSWATATTVLRTSFRNFFRRQFRIAFAGIRLAEDA